jgi:hypothetical protein
MLQSEIETIPALLSSKPRPVDWAERRGEHALAQPPENDQISRLQRL